MSSDRGDLRSRLQQALGTSYTLERELGGGGMSRVFVAEERALGRRVVVKVLSPDLAHELSVERFAREIKLSSRLQHPNIVPVLTAGDASGMPYYTMPFVEGESLRERLSKLAPGERLPTAAAIEVLRDVARALAYAHSEGVVHRDIKPENILLAFDAAVVADFGVAKATAAARTQGSSTTTALTQGGVVLGTPAYMSPEQAAGDSDVDHRADLYAWGILAYELLVGAHPFADRRSVQSLVTAHLIEQPRPLEEAAPHVPAAVRAIVTQCLAKEPTARPANASVIGEAIASVGSVGEADVDRRIARGSAAPSRFSRRAAAIVALATLAAGGASALWMTRSPGPSATAAFDAYLLGRVRVSSENREDNAAAVTALREAIAADPTLALAYAELARALAINAFYFAADSEKKQLNEDAEVAVAKALSLDPNLAAARFARGLLLWTPGRRFPHEQAIASYRQALALDSTLDEAHHQIAVVYFHVGLLDRAEREIERALALNPGNSLARFRLGVIAMYRGDYERAYAVFNSTPLDRSPSLWAFQTASALFRLGREDEAVALIDRFLREYPRDEGGVGHSVRAMMLAKAGRRTEAEAAIQKSIELGGNFGHFHHSAYNIASAYALLGEKDRAMRFLQDAADNGFPCYPLFASDGQLEALRADPRFSAFLATLKRDWEQRERTWRDGES